MPQIYFVGSRRSNLVGNEGETKLMKDYMNVSQIHHAGSLETWFHLENLTENMNVTMTVSWNSFRNIKDMFGSSVEKPSLEYEGSSTSGT